MKRGCTRFTTALVSVFSRISIHSRSLSFSLSSERSRLLAVVSNNRSHLSLSLKFRLHVGKYEQSRVINQARTVSVNNVSLGATEHDIKEFFSFSGEIEFIDLRSDTERSQIAYVTFKDPQGAETAVLLSGATIVDQSVTIALAPDYKLPPTAAATPIATENQTAGGSPSVVQRAEDVVSGMLARGFTLGKDALNRAKSFDEKHKFTSTASARVASFDQKMGLSEKFSTGATMMNDKVKEVNQKFQVSEKTKTAFSAAEQTVNNAGSALMKNRYVLTGATWVTGAFSRVKNAAGEVGQKTKEKMAEEEEGRKVADSDGQVHSPDSSAKGASGGESASKPKPAAA